MSIPAPGAAHGLRRILALSAPTFAFAGYEMARRTYLPIYLVGTVRLSLGEAGLILTIVGAWGVLVEVLFGMVCDLSPFHHRRRAFWITAGTVLLLGTGGGLLMAGPATPGWLWLLLLLGLASGWVVANLSHGAWALDAASTVLARGQVFGARALAGLAGNVAFSAAALLVPRHEHGALADPFITITALALAGALGTHLVLVLAVPERQVARSSPITASSLARPFRAFLATGADRRLALLFACVGAHMAVSGNNALFMAHYALALPQWGSTAIAVQAVAAVGGIVFVQAALRYGTPLKLLSGVFVVNMGLSTVPLFLPVGGIIPLLLWSGASGCTVAVDFTLLRVMLGERVARGARQGGEVSHAAAYYAGFHLPFNLAMTAATGVLFRLYAWAGFDPKPGSQSHAYGALMVMPVVLSAGLMAVSWMIARSLGRCLEREQGAGHILPRKLYDRILCPIKRLF